MLNIELVKGEFSIKEAEAIIIHLIDAKIKFHNNRVSNTSEVNIQKNTDSVNRIKELISDRKKIIEYFEKASPYLEYPLQLDLKIMEGNIPKTDILTE